MSLLCGSWYLNSGHHGCARGTISQPPLLEHCTQPITTNAFAVPILEKAHQDAIGYIVVQAQTSAKRGTGSDGVCLAQNTRL